MLCCSAIYLTNSASCRLAACRDPVPNPVLTAKYGPSEK